MNLSIDLNCDLGEYDDIGAQRLADQVGGRSESEGRALSITKSCEAGFCSENKRREARRLCKSAADAAIMPYISSCNIACGGHIGNEKTIAHSINLARQHQVAIGAHPSYPDRAHFGRKTMTISESALMASLRQQIRQVIDACHHAEVPLSHIKPHGALYNMAAKDARLAHALTSLCQKLAPEAALMGLAHSAMSDAAQVKGVRFIAEGFIDRAYAANSELLPRSESGAVYHDLSDIKNQALTLATGQMIKNHNGQALKIRCQSLCLHGDHPNAVSHARAVAEYLQANCIKISAC